MAKKRGRPTDYTEDMPDKLLAALNDGKSVAQFARDIGVARSTVYYWAEHHPEFSDALTRGQEYSEAYWIDRLQEMMTNKEANAPLVKLYFANRFGWQDRTAQEVTGANGGPIKTEAKIDPSGLSDSTLAELMAARKGEEG